MLWSSAHMLPLDGKLCSAQCTHPLAQASLRSSQWLRSRSYVSCCQACDEIGSVPRSRSHVTRLSRQPWTKTCPYAGGSYCHQRQCARLQAPPGATAHDRSFDARVPDSEAMLAVRQVSLRRLALHILVPATLAASWASLRWLTCEVLLGRAASCGGWGLSHVRGASIGEFHPWLGPPSFLKQQEQLPSSS